MFKLKKVLNKNYSLFNWRKSMNKFKINNIYMSDGKVNNIFSDNGKVLNEIVSNFFISFLDEELNFSDVSYDIV